MTLPVDQDPKDVLEARPGDQIHAEVEPFVKMAKDEGEALRGKVRSILLRDLALDLAISQAIDDEGATIEYLCQELGIEKPEFDGAGVIRNFQRASKLKTMLDFGRLLGLDEDEMEVLRARESERLWADPTKHLRLPTPPTQKAPSAPAEVTLSDATLRKLKDSLIAPSHGGKIK